jgi:hypothetical protein
MFQHVRCRLNGILTNLVHADRVPAVITDHKGAACNPSGGYVHALSLRFNDGLPWALGQWPQTLVTAATPSSLILGSTIQFLRRSALGENGKLVSHSAQYCQSK